MILLSAVITLGVFIAFLLYGLENKTVYEQKNTESFLPEGKKEESEQKKEHGEEIMIRVLLKTNGFQDILHSDVEVSSSNGLCIETKEGIKTIGKNERVKVKESAKITTPDQTGKITIHSIERGYEQPSYEGELDIIKTDGGAVIINELSLESYLCGVVPSEMSSSYEMEALKTQAVCARSYAYKQMQNKAYPEYNAHVDDSVSFQVYNNQKPQESTSAAVQATAGEMLWYGDEVAKTYFYSTSSGHSASIEAWGSALVDSNQYLQGVNIANQNGEDYEENLAWYRWSAVIEENVLEKVVENNAGKNIGKLKSIEITKRGTGNIVQQLEIRGSKETIVVETENKIRRMLGGQGYEITRQDGKVVDSMELLPSAFFTIEKSGTCYIINGGGYGHGIGMSQNGANELAKEGKTYKEILEFFYPGTKVR